MIIIGCLPKAGFLIAVLTVTAVILWLDCGLTVATALAKPLHVIAVPGSLNNGPMHGDIREVTRSFTLFAAKLCRVARLE